MNKQNQLCSSNICEVSNIQNFVYFENKAAFSCQRYTLLPFQIAMMSVQVLTQILLPFTHVKWKEFYENIIYKFYLYPTKQQYQIFPWILLQHSQVQLKLQFRFWLSSNNEVLFCVFIMSICCYVRWNHNNRI